MNMITMIVYTCVCIYIYIYIYIHVYTQSLQASGASLRKRTTSLTTCSPVKKPPSGP